MTPAEIETLRQLYTSCERIESEYPDTRREATAHVVRHLPKAAPGSGAVVYSQLTATNADALIDEQIARFEEFGCDFEWKHYDYDTPPDLKARLAARGFEIDELETILALPLTAAPAALLAPVTHDVRRILDPAQLADIKRIKEEVWGEEREFVGEFLRRALLESPQRMSIYVAYADHAPVSCGWIHFAEQGPFASLWGGSTLAGYRKQGFYTALLAVRVQEAIARGKQYLTIDASPMSRPIVERFGFVKLAESTPCHWRVRTRQ